MTFELRPLSLPDLLGRCLSIYVDRLPLFAGIMATPGLLSLVFILPLQAMSARPLDAFTAPPDPGALIRLAAVVLLVALVVSVAYTVVYMWAIGAATEAVSAICAGTTITMWGAYEASLARLWPLVVLSINISSRLLLIWIGVLAVMAGFTIPMQSMSTSGVIAAIAVMALLVLVGGVATFVLFLRYALAVPALLVEALRPGAAVARSVALSRGALGGIFVVIGGAVVVVVAAIALLQGPFMVAGVVAGSDTLAGMALDMAGTVAGAVAGAATSPLLVIGATVLYYDARIRTEPGFTLTT